MNNFKVIAYISLAAFVTGAYINPTLAGMIAMLLIVVLHMIQQVINFNSMVSEVPHASMSDYYDALAPIDENAIEQEETEDIWHGDSTTCPLACTITSQYNYEYQLRLTAGVDVEPATLVNYSTYSYRELQAEVKALRTDKSIKLTSKKAVLLEWLAANA